MALNIISFVNEPVDSNTYIVRDEQTKQCIIIDPGGCNGNVISEYIDREILLPVYILITHEHFDHIWSVDFLREKYLCKLVSSVTCGQAIMNPKKNLSLFYDQVGFTISAPDILIESVNYELEWNNYKIAFYQTPGHTKSGISIGIDNYLFTGDTIIPYEKTVTKLPTGNKEDLKKSVEKLFEIANDDTIIFGGHGGKFCKKDIDTRLLLGLK